MGDTIGIFINEHPVRVPAGIPAQRAVETFDGKLGAALASGAAYITDGVGRRIAADRPVAVGDIYRVVVSARRRERTGSGD